MNLLRLLDGKVCAFLFIYMKEGVGDLKEARPATLPWDPWGIRPRAKVESGFRDNLVSVLQSEGMDDGL